jgi:hypothetical protein
MDAEDGQEEGQENDQTPAVGRGEEAAIQEPTEDNEAEDDDSAGTMLGDHPVIPSDINLRCKKLVALHFPKLRGKGKLLPPPTFLMDVLLLQEWRQKTHGEQKVASAEWMKNTAPVKKRLKGLVPGVDCTCCQRKARNDRGRRRPTRQSRRRRGEAAPLPDANAAQQQEQAAIPYPSLGSSQMQRDNVLPVEQGPYKRTSFKKLEHARSVQGQGGVQALKAMHAANKSFARALTACTVEPKLDETTNTFAYANPARAPRVFGLLIWVNQVSETRMSGGILPSNQLRKDKTEITYISSCKEDAERILDVVLTDAVDNRDNYEKKKFYGTGKRLVDNINSVEAESKLRRSKPDAADMQESQDQIPLSLAPTSYAV